MGYMDNPDQIEYWLGRATGVEHAAFDRGYHAALMGLLEQLTETKVRLLSKIMDSDDKDERIELSSRVHILTVFEEHYRKRAEKLETVLPA